MWSAAEPCRTRTLSLEMQEWPPPPSKKDEMGCFGGWGVCEHTGQLLWNGSEGTPRCVARDVWAQVPR